MAVAMKGGASGCRHDYLPAVPDSGAPQPVLDTARSTANPALHFTQNTGNRGGDATPDVPTGCSVNPTDGSGGGSDIVQQDITGDVGASRALRDLKLTVPTMRP